MENTLVNHNIRKKILFKKYPFLIFLLLALDCNLFYLIDTKSFFIFGLAFQDIFMLLKIIIFLFFIMKTIHLKIDRYYICLMIIPFILMIFSSFSGFLSYGQSFFEGAIAQRYWFSSLLMFFPFIYCFRLKKISLNDFIQVLFIFCIIYICICILQYFLTNTIQFTYSMNSGATRYNEPRYYFEYGLVVFVALISMDFFVRKSKLKYLIIPILVGYFSIVICKARMLTIAFLISLLFIVFFSKIIYKRKRIYIGIGLIFTFIFLLSDFGTDIINNILVGSESTTYTLGIREIGRNYYFSLLTKSLRDFVFGFGVPNIHNKVAQQISGNLDKIYTVDNGIFGVMFQYGFIGILLWLLIIILNIRMSYKIYKNYNISFYLAFIVFDIIGFITLEPMFWRAYLTFPIFLAMVYYQYNIINYKNLKSSVPKEKINIEFLS